MASTVNKLVLHPGQRARRGDDDEEEEEEIPRHAYCLIGANSRHRRISEKENVKLVSLLSWIEEKRRKVARASSIRA